MSNPRCMKWLEDAQLATTYQFVPDDPEERAFLIAMIPEGEP